MAGSSSDLRRTGSSSDLRRTMQEVESEIFRAVKLKVEGRFTYTIADPIPNMWKSAMIVEETGEVAREVIALEGIVQEKGDLPALRKELIQVAALATAWANSIPRS
jgi:hypothetical protein